MSAKIKREKTANPAIAALTVPPGNPVRMQGTPTRTTGLLAGLGWLFVLVGASVVFAGAPAGSPESAPVGRFERPATPRVREVTREILDDPRFKPRETLFQRLIELLNKWFRRDRKERSGIGTVLIWIFVIWSVLVLVLILGHLIWTLATVFGLRGNSAMRAGTPHFRRAAEISVDEWYARMRRLAEAGEFREAIGAMMTALLRRLDRVGAIRFHDSKTNGDYVVEFAAARPGGNGFREFVIYFDGIIYGGLSCGRKTFDRMHALHTTVLAHAGQES